MSIGSQLREAREGKQLTLSAVAGATRSKIPIIEAIERDDFSVFPASIYGKGFIRLYAQVVGLDPQPLLEAYSAQARRAAAPTLVSADAPAPAPSVAPSAKETPPGTLVQKKTTQEFDLFNAPEARPRSAVEVPPTAATSRVAVARELLREVFIRWSQALRESLRLGRASAAKIPVQKDPWTAVPVVIGAVIILIFVVSGLSQCARRPDATGARGPHGAGSQLRLAVDVPEPYFE